MSNTSKSKYMVDNTTRNAERQKVREARKFGNKGAFLTKFTARAVRRAAGDFKPVNEAASLEQAPDGKFAKSVANGYKWTDETAMKNAFN